MNYCGPITYQVLMLVIAMCSPLVRTEDDSFDAEEGEWRSILHGAEATMSLWDPVVAPLLGVIGAGAPAAAAAARKRAASANHHKGVLLELCESSSRQVEVYEVYGERAVYEYRPTHYQERRCQGARTPDNGDQQRCLVAGSRCVQRYREVHILRRRKDLDFATCWEPMRPIAVPSGCDCLYHPTYAT